MKRIGFTGTRNMISLAQFTALETVLIEESPDKTEECHHGDCVGADAAFAGVASFRGLRLVAHPCDLKGMCAYTPADEVREAKKPLDRNKDIVNECDVLIACPAGPEEQRSGTWSTVRYARRVGKPVVIVWPDGEVTREEAKK